MDERLEVKPDPNVHVGPMDPDDVVEPNTSVRRGLDDVAQGNVKRLDWVTTNIPSEGSRRCMIYRDNAVK